MTDELESLPELDPAASDLLGAYAEQTARGSADVEAALSRVVDQVSAPVPSSTAGGTSAAAKILIATAVLGAGIWGASRLQPSGEGPEVSPVAVAVVDSRPSEVSTDPVSDEPPTSELAPTVEESIVEVQQDSAPSAEVESSPAVESRPAKPRRARASKAVDTEPRPSLAEELRLLKQVRTDLRAGRGASALTGLREHRRRYPSSTLAEERDATEVTALCTLGRAPEARVKASAFTRRFPTSQRDVLAACDR